MHTMPTAAETSEAKVRAIYPADFAPAMTEARPGRRLNYSGLPVRTLKQDQLRSYYTREDLKKSRC